MAGSAFISRCAVDGGSPCVIRHDPLLAVIQTANISLINKTNCRKPTCEPYRKYRRYPPYGSQTVPYRNKHNLRYRFTGFQTERGRRCLQDAVDRRVKVICQRARCLIEVGLINHLIGDTGVISAGYDLIQLYRLIRQIVAPVEARQTNGGIIGHAADRPLHLHTRRYLLWPGFADYNIGVNALVQNLQTDDLACKLDFRFKGFAGYTVIVRCLGFLDGVTTQRQQLGDCKAALVGNYRVYNILCLVVDLKGCALQERTCGQTIDTVVVLGLFDDLDLTILRGVFPDDFGGFTTLYAEGTLLRVADISLRPPEFLRRSICPLPDRSPARYSHRCRWYTRQRCSYSCL